MTICNMSIEWGAKAGMVAPDRRTIEYVRGRAHAPTGADWAAAVEYWRTLRTDDDAVFDREVVLDASTMTPFVTWGTNPGQGVPLGGVVPDPAAMADPAVRSSAERALAYMALAPGTPMRDIEVDTVFLGSCTNGRIEDLRAAATVIAGRSVADGVRMFVVPGSSMCLGMNPDQLSPGERSASTSNRNFEGRQGKGGRTHLVSPLVAAATAVTGRLSSPADLPAVATQEA